MSNLTVGTGGSTFVFCCIPECEPEHDRFAEHEAWEQLTRELDLDGGQLSSVCSRVGCSEDAVFTAAFAELVSVFTGQEDVRFCLSAGAAPIPVKEDAAVGQEDVRFCLSADSALISLRVDGAQTVDDLLRYSQKQLGAGDPGEALPDSGDLAVGVFLETGRDSDGKYYIKLDYRSGSFSPEWAGSFTDTYRKIIHELFIKTAVKDIDPVSDQQANLMEGFNKTEAPREDTDVTKLFRRCAGETPDAVAIVAEGRRYTYGETDRITDAIAGYLHSCGIGKGSVVAILIPRNEYIPLAALGVLKSGAAYLPLDPSYPESRLTFMTEDAGASLLIADRGLKDRLGSWTGEVLFTEDISGLPDAAPFDPEIRQEDLFVLLYTSGTTGRPKGAMIRHGNLSELAAWGHGYFHMDKTIRYAAYASFGFDAHLLDYYPVLTCGGSLYIISDDIRLDLGALAEFINANGITVSLMTTQVGRQFALAYEGGSLQNLITGGEALVPVDPANIRFRLHNAYGPTECTVLSTIQPVDRLYHRIPIGQALENVKLYVVDQYRRRVPLFAPGELLIAGPHVTGGYLNLPEKTAESFIDNPFDGGEYGRAYRTGDTVRRLADGRVDFLGRSDSQVKIRGFRIELTEVEAVIRDYPGIRDATVQAFADENTGMKYLAAYVVSDDRIDVRALNAFIKERKPPYLVPAVTMQIDAIPLTTNNKVDKRALPLPEREKQDYEQPATEAEQIAFDCAAEALGHREFGVLTDLEEAGLSSLGAMQLNVLLSRAFHKAVRLSEVRSLVTVQDIAAYFAAAAKEHGYALQKSYPLSSVQQGMYAECLSRPGSTSYNLPFLLQLDPSVDLAQLKEALTAVIDAHPYLKARLAVSGTGEVTAERDESAGIEIRTINKSELVHGFSGLVYPFRLTQEPLIRALVIRDEASSYLFLDIHHLIFDGESLVVFMRDLEKAYRGERLDKEVFTGFEVALDELQQRQSTAYEEAKAYYASLLDGMDTDCRPMWDRNESDREAGSLSLRVAIDRDAFNGFLHERKTTANAVWNAAFGLVLAKFLGRRDCVYSTVYNGRNDTRLAESVGMFVHTLPVVCRIEEGETGERFISRIGRQINDSMSHDIFSFAEICQSFEMRSDILFVYEGTLGTQFTVGGKAAKEVRIQQSDNLKAVMTFYVYDSEDGFLLECEYEAGRYESWNVLSMLESLEVAMRALLLNEPVERISLLTPQQRETLLAFNRTEREVEDTDIATLFSRSAKRWPDRTALIYRERQLTYRELDDLTDRIACHVAGLGMGPEDVVSILVKRSEYMVVASLGVLKAGAAYQPLDPTYPPERLAFMVEDAGAGLLIADEDLLELLPDYKGPVLLTKDIASLPEPGELPCKASSDNLFILLYTSGTTGQPKGVMLTHRNLVNFCDWYRNFYHLTQESVVAAYASFGFDANMMDLYPALTNGAAVCIVPEDMRIDLPVLNRYYQDNGVTHSFMTTQMGRMFAMEMGENSLQHLSVGGEKLVPLEPPEGCALYNGYGPTECTIFTAVQEVDRLYARVPIGRPLSNYKVYVVDSSGQELPVGAMGELWVAGCGVGRGYLNQPEKTARVFTPNPLCSEKGFDRVFRTGDIVRRLGDGRIDFVGRNDGQVKIRGFRVELAEVESAIREFPDIRDVTVQAFDDEAFGGKFIAAYVVSDEPVDFAMLESFIRRKKPPYMVPAAFMQLDRIPLNQNQKVNRHKLPKPERRGEDRKFVEPATPLEREICEEYASILGLEKVGATDSFFEIGGSSISAAKVVMFAMNKGYNIVYKDVFNNPSARELARAIEGSGKEGNANAAADFDYTQINELIAFNAMEHVDEISGNPIGNVILTGATGFLGIHVLWDFIQHCDGKITCFLRRGTYQSARHRMIAMLMYYFGENTEHLFDDRIFCVDGDITEAESVKALASVDADTVINCAACVKHFAEDDILDRINVKGVENLVELCTGSSKRLVHISTLSVAGEMPEKDLVLLKEDMLYFGQNVENDYVRTKFMAERVILDARIKRDLDAVILRAGNLMGRNTDGEFQINFATNAFMRSLWAYVQLGGCPYTTLEQSVEFSPIDSVARAVNTLAGVDRRFSVFHLNNNHTVTMADILEAMHRYGFHIQPVSEEHFRETLAEASKHSEESRVVLALVAYANKKGDDLKMVEADNRFTTNALFRLGFKWPIVDDAYLEKQLWSLDTLFYFSKD